jgi:hypothetical protein
LAANGYTLPVGAPAPAVLRQRGSAYIDATYGARFKGVPTGGPDQDRAWPRTGATVFGTMLATSVVPLTVINASYLAAWVEGQKAGSLSGGASNGTGVVKRQKVEGIEREFFEAKQQEGELYDPLAPSGSTKIIPDIDNALKPYLDLSGTVHGVGLWSIGQGAC